MRCLLGIVAVFQCVALTGCVTLPAMDDEEIGTALVVLNIKCELRRAVWETKPKHEWLRDWNAVISLTLSVTHKGGVAVDSSLTHPLTPGSFLLPVGLNASGEGQRTEKIVFKEKLGDLATASLPCPDVAGEDRRYALLGGSIGLEDLLERARLSKEKAQIAPSSIDYSLNFKIARSANVGPRFNLIPMGINTYSGGLRWDGNRDSTHTLNIILGRNPRCLFPEIEKEFSGNCPTFVASYALPTRSEAHIVEGKKIFKQLPGAAVEEKRVLQPKVLPGKARGLSRDADDALDRALTRSILQDQLQELRQRNLSTP